MQVSDFSNNNQNLFFNSNQMPGINEKPDIIQDIFAKTIQEEDVVIVGGGMSGLTAAYALQKQGIKSALFEGRERLGGRTCTHYFNEAKTAFYEEGGTTIDSDHNFTINLAKELDVELVKKGYGSRKVSVVNEQKLQDQKVLISELEKLIRELENLNNTIKWDDTFDYNYENKEFREKPLTQVLSSLNDFGRNFIKVYFEDETGVSIENAPLSSLKWILDDLIEYKELLDAKNSLFTPNFLIDLKAYSYNVKSGISHFVNSIEKKIKNSSKINVNHILTKIEKNDKYVLTFLENGVEKIIRANHVIMTLPFSTLRNVTIDESVGLSPLQKKAIKNLSYGTNSKIGLPLNAIKNIYDDMLFYVNLDGHFNGWAGQNTVTFMINAEEGKNLTEEKAAELCRAQEEYLKKEYPCIKSFETPFIKNWSQDPFSLGSYSTRIANEDVSFGYSSLNEGLKEMRQYAEPLDNNHFIFAGEHTRADGTAGYIEGAIRSGYKAAELFGTGVRK